MTNNERYRLSDLAFHLGCGVNALEAIHYAMEDGVNAAENYTDGLFFVLDQMDVLVKELSAMTDGRRTAE